MSVPDQQDFHTTLLDVLPFIKDLFTQKWGERDYHKFCKGPCSATLVLDGHQKATRRVCAIKNISIPSVDGSMKDVKVGCLAAPAFRNKKCDEHRWTNENENEHDDKPNI